MRVPLRAIDPAVAQLCGLHQLAQSRVIAHFAEGSVREADAPRSVPELFIESHGREGLPALDALPCNDQLSCIDRKVYSAHTR